MSNVISFYTISYLLIGDFMIFLRNSAKAFGFGIISLLILTIFLTIFSYFNFFGPKLVNIFKIINLCIAGIVGGINIGKCSQNKGWLEGLKFGILFTIIILLFNLLGIGKAFSGLNIISYVIIIVTSILGSMIGINLKKDEE